MSKFVASVMGSDSDEGILAQSGGFKPGVHFVDLSAVQNGVRVFLHANVFSGGPAQLVYSTDASVWTSYDPETELAGTPANLPEMFTMMGFDIPASARYVGIRNATPMDANVLLWAVGV